MTKKFKLSLGAAVLVMVGMTGCSALSRTEAPQVPQKESASLSTRVQRVAGQYAGGKKITTADQIKESSMEIDMGIDPINFGRMLAFASKKPVIVNLTALKSSTLPTATPMAAGALPFVPAINGTGGTAIPVPVTQPEVKTKKKLLAKGKIQEILDRYVEAHGLGWEINHQGVIEISKYQVGMFNLGSIWPDAYTVDASATGGSGGNGGGNSNGSGSGSGNSTNTTTVKSALTVKPAEQFVAAAKELLSKDGKVSLTGGQLVVADNHKVVRQIRELFRREQLTAAPLKVVLQVVEIQETDHDRFKLSWSELLDAASSKWGLSLLSPAGASIAGAGKATVRRTSANSTQSAAIEALSEIGSIRIVQDRTFTTMSGRAVSASNAKTLVYPARTVPVSASSSGILGTTATPGVEPGTLTTGFFVTVTPKLTGDGTVGLSVQYSSSQLANMQSFSANGVTLQYPELTSTNHFGFGSVKMNEPAILFAGEEHQEDVSRSAFDRAISPLFGGGASYSKSRKTTVIVVTVSGS